MLVYLALGARLFYIQVVRASYYSDKARNLTGRTIILPARRGTIYDRDGSKLAVTVDAYDIYVQPKQIKAKEETADRLSAIIGCDRDNLLQIIESGKTFRYVARRVDIEIGERVKEERLPGTGALRTMKRIYPGNELAAHIIGFVNVDGKGIEGLERAFDKELRGRDGYILADVDAKGRVIPGSKRKQVDPVDGKSIVLSIDSRLQHSLERWLADSYGKYSAAGASAVMLDPKTGEILALANMPTFNPNDMSHSDAAGRRNRAITDLYEPGSTLKTITASAALNEKVVSTTETFVCNGSMKIGRRTIRCSLHPPFMHGHGSSNVAKILRYSCNIGASDLGFRLGAKKLYDYEDAFGMYEKPGSGMPGEVRGWHDSWKDWNDVRLANIAFGQGIAVTPLQVARAYGAVANGGELMRPFVVKRILGTDGSVEKEFEPEVTRRVISVETSRLVSEMLTGVVSDGTGKTASVEGYRIAGKTGSAQKASTTGRGYAPGKFIASFVGFLPASDPKIVLLVAVDEPKGSHWGATVAAPVFQQVARTAMWEMKVPPDATSVAPADERHGG
ncbi:MAG: peptidoglycan D,D-transpeptidase FtsI family protein [Armatimonadota bacterium]